MGCGNCGSCDTADGVPAGCGNNGHCATGGCNKLNTYNWLSDICFVDDKHVPDIVEVRFKGTRKGFYQNAHQHDLHIGDPVVVDTSSGGYDLGFVSLTGELVPLQMKKYGVEADHRKMLTIQRVAREEDLEIWEAGKNREHETMVAARRSASELGLVMKISDVEYQGDGNKAIFYYTADGRVDFRELIKVLARTFRVKVEMRQIGLRQEAGRLGGIGSCGRELCCSTWLTDFNSVPTTAARYQNLFLNPLKLSGQCGRLKCCLNYELDTYLEALEDFPKDNTILQTKKGKATVMKTDILTRQMWFTIRNDDPATPNPVYQLSVDDVHTVLEMNRRGEHPEDLDDFTVEEEDAPQTEVVFKDVIGESQLDRFDRQKKASNKRRRSRNKGIGGSSARKEASGAQPASAQAPGARNAPGGGERKEQQAPSSKKTSTGNKKKGNRRPSPPAESKPAARATDSEGPSPEAAPRQDASQRKAGGSKKKRSRGRGKKGPSSSPNTDSKS